jgi:hypothetical protein
VLALSRRNTNAAEVIIFLHRFVQVLVEYFKELEEESIRDNFVIIYELMDEMMDFGVPQTTESKILQECVCPSASLSMPIYKTGRDGIRLMIGLVGTSRRNPTSSRYKSARRWRSPTPSRGVRRESGTGRTKSSWT